MLVEAPGIDRADVAATVADLPPRLAVVLLSPLLNYDESKSDYHLHAYQVHKEKLNNDPIMKEAYLAKQREKNKKYMSNEENREKKKLYNKEYRLRKKKEALENKNPSL